MKRFQANVQENTFDFYLQQSQKKWIEWDQGGKKNNVGKSNLFWFTGSKYILNVSKYFITSSKAKVVEIPSTKEKWNLIDEAVTTLLVSESCID